MKREKRHGIERELSIKRIRSQKKYSILIVSVLLLTCTLIQIGFQMSEGLKAAYIENRKAVYGEWEQVFLDMDESSVKVAEENPFLAQTGKISIYGAIAGDYLENRQMNIGTMDETAWKLGRLEMKEGRLPENEHEIAGADELERVRKSIFMAEKSEIRVKINTVLQKGVNDEEWKSLAELAKKNKLDVRFIELMPIGQGRAENGISGSWVLGKLKEAYGIEGEFYPLEGRFGNGPAVYYQLPGFQGKIGLISALHGKFCDRCNRIRMTSTGKLKACLCYADTISVFEAARHGSEEEIRKCLEQAIRGKPKMHHFEEQNFITEQKNMSQIGG